MQKRKDLSIYNSNNKKYKKNQVPIIDCTSNIDIDIDIDIIQEQEQNQIKAQIQNRIKKFVKIEKEMIIYAIKSYQKQINNLSDVLTQTDTQKKIVIYALEKANTEACNLIPVLKMIHIKVLKEADLETDYKVCTVTEMQIKVFAHIFKEAKKQTKNIADVINQENLLTYYYVIEQVKKVIDLAQKQIHILINAFKLVDNYQSEREKIRCFLSEFTNMEE
jgi:hypothetical protein